MGKTNGPYKAISQLGRVSGIGDQAELEQFLHEWKYHNPLQAEQLAFADRLATIASVGYYHGGDELYQLDGIPGIWHERCLHPMDDSTLAP